MIFGKSRKNLRIPNHGAVWYNTRQLKVRACGAGFFV